MKQFNGRAVEILLVEDNPGDVILTQEALSSSKSEQDIVRSYNLHANSYIVKLLSLKSFVDVVSTIENFWFSIVVLPEENIAEDVG